MACENIIFQGYVSVFRNIKLFGFGFLFNVIMVLYILYIALEITDIYTGPVYTTISLGCWYKRSGVICIFLLNNNNSSLDIATSLNW